MSGGGGGGGGGGRSSGSGGFVPPRPTGPAGKKPGSNDPCDILISLPLSAVQPAHVKKIKVGDDLDVELQNSRGAAIVVATAPSDGSIVGAIAYRGVQALIDCLNSGNKYIATVIHATQTSVKVQISRT